MKIINKHTITECVALPCLMTMPSFGMGERHLRGGIMSHLNENGNDMARILEIEMEIGIPLRK